MGLNLVLHLNSLHLHHETRMKIRQVVQAQLPKSGFPTASVAPEALKHQLDARYEAAMKWKCSFGMPKCLLSGVISPKRGKVIRRAVSTSDIQVTRPRQRIADVSRGMRHRASAGQS